MMSGNKASRAAFAAKKNIVYEMERFEYAWENVKVLNFMYHYNCLQRPITTKAMNVNFASDVFNGTWSFLLARRPEGPLIVKAVYTKINALLKGEFEIKLEMTHDSKVIWSGEEKSGQVMMTEETLPDFLTMSNKRSNGVEKKSEKVTIRMCKVEWIISHVLMEELIAARSQSPDITFCFHIQGRYPKNK